MPINDPKLTIGSIVFNPYQAQAEMQRAFVEPLARYAHSLMRLESERTILVEALERLRDAALDSNDHCYGTLSTAFVLDIVQAALKCGDHAEREAG